MSKMPLTVTWKHSHECEHKDEEVETYPQTMGPGLSAVIVPTCEEALIELERINITRY